MHENKVIEYIKFFEELSLSSLGEMNSIIDDNIHFKDPFNDIRGLEAYKLILEDMFKKVPDIKFFVKSFSSNNKTTFLKWECISNTTGFGTPWIIEGVSEIRFSKDNKVLEHIDYWDSSQFFYEKIPILGALLRLIRRHVSAKK